MNPVVSRGRPLKHYLWGNNCDGWNLVDQPGLAVKMERMPPHTAEEAHYHKLARQFFFILKGVAVFEFTGGYLEKLPAGEKWPMMSLRPATPWAALAEGRVEVKAQEGLEIPPRLSHRIVNETEEDIEFILCSQPSTTGDRINSPDGPAITGT